MSGLLEACVVYRCTDEGADLLRGIMSEADSPCGVCEMKGAYSPNRKNISGV